MKSIYLSNFIARNKNRRAGGLYDCLVKGAKKYGYVVRMAPMDYRELNSKRIDTTDILIVWNRHCGQDELALKFENRGARVLSIENPYIKVEGEKYISVGYGHHNNMMFAPKCLDNGERFKSFNKEIKPWKTDGENILITTQAKKFDNHGLGINHIRQPALWDSEIIESLKRKTTKHIVFRQHPNGKKFKDVPDKRLFSGITLSSPNIKNIPLLDDLKDAHGLVTWNSNSATEALLEGVPVFYCASYIFSAECCNQGIHHINNPKKPDNRNTMFNRMAWAQYTLPEVASGYFFEVVLS